MIVSALFKKSFETFKVFENLSLAQANEKPCDNLKSILEILNHLIVWQKTQLGILSDHLSCAPLTEKDSWLETGIDFNDLLFEQQKDKFKGQMDALWKIIDALGLADIQVNQKLKVIQEMSVHLAFHVGEIVLIRRINNNYPKPEDMAAFLNQP